MTSTLKSLQLDFLWKNFLGHYRVRCRVAQVGGMGILERLNRTFKHEFVFRHEVKTLADLKALLPAFLHWYNQQRFHSRLEYRTPAAVLADESAAILS